MKTRSLQRGELPDAGAVLAQNLLDAEGRVALDKGRVLSADDIHRIALEAPLDQQWMGGIVDKYFNNKGTRYWAIWTVKAS